MKKLKTLDLLFPLALIALVVVFLVLAFKGTDTNVTIKEPVTVKLAPTKPSDCRIRGDVAICPAPHGEPGQTHRNRIARPSMPRIVNGHYTKASRAPWMAAIVDAQGPLCGATVVRPRMIATAAHCVQYIIEEQVPVAIRTLNPNGSYHLTSPDLGAYDPSFNSEKTGARHDGGAITTVSSMGAPSVRLPLAQPRAGVKLQAFGWGLTEDHVQPTRLKEATLKLYRRGTCSRAFGFALISGELCAGDTKHLRDTCSGDSGGPLVQGVGRSAVLRGIVSYGPEHCDLGLGVYVNVRSELWLRRAIKYGLVDNGSPHVGRLRR